MLLLVCALCNHYKQYYFVMTLFIRIFSRAHTHTDVLEPHSPHIRTHNRQMNVNILIEIHRTSIASRAYCCSCYCCYCCLLPAANHISHSFFFFCGAHRALTCTNERKKRDTKKWNKFRIYYYFRYDMLVYEDSTSYTIHCVLESTRYAVSLSFVQVHIYMIHWYIQ